MNPVSLGQQYPMYANCFDRLTTNGILADDVIGYITGTPSPYLQNYVAQRGALPMMPGQIMPDALPTAPMPAPMSVPTYNQPAMPAQIPTGPVYNDIPRNIDQNTLVKKDKYATLKKTAAALLIAGLAGFGIYKGFALFRHGGAGFRTAMSNAWSGVKNLCSTLWTKTVSFCKTGATKIANFFKTLWNRIFHRTP